MAGIQRTAFLGMEAFHSRGNRSLVSTLSRLELRWDQMHTKSTFDAGEGGIINYDYVDATQVGLYANFIYKF